MSALHPDDAMPGRDEEAADWCMRMAEAALTPEEQEAFDVWIEKPGHAEAFEEAVDIWRGVEGAAETPSFIQMRSLALENFRKAQRQRWTRRLSGRAGWLTGIAAALLLMVTGSLFLLRDQAEAYETGIGERRVVVLADGSKISLDAATTVEVRLRDDRRELHLTQGRAKFDVAKDPLRPFAVTVGDKIVVAIGTSFSVERLQAQIRVLLYQGNVDVLEVPAGREKARRLEASGREFTPGHEMVTFVSSKKARILDANVARSLSWEAGQLNFDQEPLYSAVERMNRYSDRKIEIGDLSIANLRVDGVFSAGDTAAFVEGVTSLYPIQADGEQGRVVLRPDRMREPPP